eukprot:gene9269-8335_t
MWLPALALLACAALAAGQGSSELKPLHVYHPSLLL